MVFVIIIGVIAISSMVILKLLYKTHESILQDRAVVEIDKIVKASIGDLSNDFGFLGDMGRLPQSISELIYQGSLPSPVENPSGSGIYSGWRGPYLDVRVKNPQGIVDPYGNNYTILLLQKEASGDFRVCSSGCTNWVVFSPGKDGRYNSTYPLNKSYSENRDNIWAPSYPLEVSQISGTSYYTLFSSKTIRVSALRSDFMPVNLRLTVFYPSNGASSFVSREFENPLTFSNIPVGKRVIMVEVINDSGESAKTYIFPSSFIEAKKNQRISINELPESLNIVELQYQSQTVQRCVFSGGCNRRVQICSSFSCYIFFRCRDACCESDNTCSIDPLKEYCCENCFIRGHGGGGGGFLRCKDLCCTTGGSGGGNECKLTVKVDSSLNSTGVLAHFDLLIKGYDENGEKVYESSAFVKNSSSPFFVLEDDNAPCTIKTIRIESSGAGGNISKTVSLN